MQTEIEKANEKAVRNAYHVAEMKDVPAWVACFTDDGVFTDESTNTTFKGEKQLGEIVVIFATAFPDLRASGGAIVQPPTSTPAGRNMVVRDVEGVVFELVKPRRVLRATP